ncbi:glucose 1-dehydrogenase [Amycolatopsis sp. RM579]|uniref:Glucose 1-dehydrogenase n=1 Tax=Amycolatopsis pithecellobii TaxID=664692 RepID=A0A6N7Z7V3_9PSEU|nr:glucose 1-dehydrogenase [Amycolatopsis pithecellobii]
MSSNRKNVLITGAGSRGGIGAAIAHTFARDGATVLITGRHQERGDEVVADILAAGGEARFILADLSDHADVDRLIKEAGDVDVLVNNAASYRASIGPSLDQDLAANVESWDVNIRAAFALTTGFARGMAARGGGAVVNISSIAGTRHMPYMSTYGAQKAAIDAYTRSWAAEWGHANVRVNGIAPGNVSSENVTEFIGAERFQEMSESSPLGRLGTPEEIAEVVVFVASDRASFLTGQTILVDGGHMAKAI